MDAPIDQVLIISPCSQEILPQFGDAAVEERIRAALTELGCAHETMTYRGFRELAAQLADVAPGTLVLPNGTHTEPDLSSPFVASVLDRHGIRYVGSDAVGMAAMSKIWSKHVLHSHAIATLPGAVYPGRRAVAFIERATRPLVVKPEYGANSQGVTLVERPSNALAVAAELHKRYGQRIVLEPWARSREYTVAVMETSRGGTIVAPLEIRLPEGDAFLSRDVKLHRVAGTARRVSDPARRVALCDLATAVFRACRLRDLGRIDMLETDTGELVVIDVNPHPGFKPGPARPSYYPDALALERRWSYEDVILNLIAGAAWRCGLSLQPHVTARLADPGGAPVEGRRRRSR